jgi:hypothetical protein
MRNILGKIVLMSAVVATTFAASAATSEKRFEVPFSFTVAGQSWPAGTYLIQKAQGTNVVLQSQDSTRTFAMTLGPGDPSPSDTRAIMTFAEDNQNHALKAVQYGPMVTSLNRRHDGQLEHMPVRMVQGQ